MKVLLTGQESMECLMLLGVSAGSTSNTNSITFLRHSVNGIQEHECVSKDVGDMGCCRVIREWLPVAYSVSDPEMTTGNPMNHSKDLELWFEIQSLIDMTSTLSWGSTFCSSLCHGLFSTNNTLTGMQGLCHVKDPNVKLGCICEGDCRDDCTEDHCYQGNDPEVPRMWS